jgi:hypothetical protein
MQFTQTCLCAALILVTSLSSASGQTGEKTIGTERDAGKSATQTHGSDGVKKEAPTPAVLSETSSIWIHFAGGRRMQVDEVTEHSDGVWYRLGNVTTFIDKVRVERIERSTDPDLASLSETFDGSRRWSIADSARVENFFMSRFNRPLPIAVYGQSELHTRWGLDHRRSMDVGLHPDSVEGRILIRFLVSEGIPFLAFRRSIPGVATGPHIHVGHGSRRISARN